MKRYLPDKNVGFVILLVTVLVIWGALFARSWSDGRAGRVLDRIDKVQVSAIDQALPGQCRYDPVAARQLQQFLIDEQFPQAVALINSHPVVCSGAIRLHRFGYRRTTDWPSAVMHFRGSPSRAADIYVLIGPSGCYIPTLYTTYPGTNLWFPQRSSVADVLSVETYATYHDRERCMSGWGMGKMDKLLGF
ncbi:MAG: hypothetical protein Alpg2KO_12990 [Alphaproteobacteria bacterium]